jgi:four helix bundle protein
MKYDLEERCIEFSERIIDLLKAIKKDEISSPMITQLTKSATSICANYMEANEAASKKDFKNKVCIARKESNETKYWLRMISKICPVKKEECRILWNEAHEITLIFLLYLRTVKPKVQNFKILYIEIIYKIAKIIKIKNFYSSNL